MTSRMRPFQRSLPMQLMLAREAVMQRFRPHLNANGLTDQQWRIIRALNEVDALDMAALGRACCLHTASLSRSLPNLEADGLISRKANKQDQRRVSLSLTAKGRRLFETVAPKSEEIYAQLAQEIGLERLEQVYDLLDEVIGILENPQPRAKSAAAARSRDVVRRGKAK
ncbi:homoprotocatechuate degradation operon regulator HpaR [Pseudorhodoplanes sp.]|uniref:homoprotocatechuate degradation operon regulator HpaR n=1 Tax=Pseudorhodoplanes sp. TaxID=1934341 RepID=UPI002CD48ABF|nr:homoprotocatechuate degradation operon regulator HpaR [Pseudorhodoplanes sp.]HWV54731.1 homoprotocatechuate degradation operon regulator HpaR [Pseudorhodoplanes sp.]